MHIDVYLADRLMSPQAASAKNQQIHAWLDEHLGAEQATPVIHKNQRGKPALKAPHERHAISITHTQTLLMLAISSDVTWLGVDAESIDRPINHSISRLAKRFFHPSEHAVIHGQPVEQQATTFLKLWTMKEALLKGLGHGLSGHINHIRFDWQAHHQDWRLKPSTVTSNATPHVLRLPSDRHWLALAYGTEARQTTNAPTIRFHQQPSTQP